MWAVYVITIPNWFSMLSAVATVKMGAQLSISSHLVSNGNSSLADVLEIYFSNIFSKCFGLLKFVNYAFFLESPSKHWFLDNCLATAASQGPSNTSTLK